MFFSFPLDVLRGREGLLIFGTIYLPHHRYDSILRSVVPIVVDISHTLHGELWWTIDCWALIFLIFFLIFWGSFPFFWGCFLIVDRDCSCRLAFILTDWILKFFLSIRRWSNERQGFLLLPWMRCLFFDSQLLGWFLSVIKSCLISEKIFILCVFGLFTETEMGIFHWLWVLSCWWFIDPLNLSLFPPSLMNYMVNLSVPWRFCSAAALENGVNGHKELQC